MNYYRPATQLILTLFLFSGCAMNDATENYQEPYRPQFHFTPPTHWMNDPNGMFYYKGEYHLFYQHYPEDIVWGPMHWGHAVSKDMVHWEHLPIAFYPDRLGYIFSGSAVVDWKNTSGLGTAENPPIIALFTYHDPEGEKANTNDFQTQGMAYSLDQGRSWTKYAQNPVLANPGIRDFRDPKVIWHEASERWIMSLAVQDHIAFYSSPNLIDWEKQSSFGQALGAHGGVWECPDLFPLEDQNGNRKWVLLVSINPGGPQGGSATQYFVGDFDGQSFTPQDDEVRWMDWGSDNYAGVTFSYLPETESNRILMGWMSNWAYANQVPTQPWRSALTLPRSLSLYQQENERYVLQSAVIDAVDSLLGPAHDLQPEQSNALGADTIKLTLEVQPDTDWSVELSNPLGETFKVYHQEGQIRIDRSQSGDNQFSDAFAKVMQIPLEQVTVRGLILYIDRSSVELFVNDKALVATNLIFPTVPFDQVRLDKIKAGKQQIISSIW